MRHSPELIRRLMHVVRLAVNHFGSQGNRHHGDMRRNPSTHRGKDGGRVQGTSPAEEYIGPPGRPNSPLARLPRSSNLDRRAKGSCRPTNEFGTQGRLIPVQFTSTKKQWAKCTTKTLPISAYPFNTTNDPFHPQVRPINDLPVHCVCPS
ncbi:hypothetical protein Bbelb_316750 [Branchiostoma belcheri]|nr:hypothetical protein Bbelb_316750 [Branchiostoma belcheri]